MSLAAGLLMFMQPTQAGCNVLDITCRNSGIRRGVRNLDPTNPNSGVGRYTTDIDEALRRVTDIFVSNNTDRYLRVTITYPTMEVCSTVGGGGEQCRETKYFFFSPGEKNAFVVDNVPGKNGSVTFAAEEVSPQNTPLPNGLRWSSRSTTVSGSRYTYTFNIKR